MDNLIKGKKHIELGRKDGVDFRKEYFGLDFKYNDGGRKEAGYKGDTGDCVVRSIAIASNQPYQIVYDKLYSLNKNFRIQSNSKLAYKMSPKDDSPRLGNHKKIYKDYIESLGFKWFPTMKIGQGCKVHLRKNELPSGTLIVNVSRHLTTVINGVINDTYDPSRDATRCVYGFWINDLTYTWGYKYA